jgi:phage-related minor tail protein
MADELKSAWQLALEKLEAQDLDPIEQLSGEQKAAIAEIRSRYQARIAETEIAAEGQIRKAAQAGDYDAVTQARENLVSERGRLNREMEDAVEKVRQGH